MCAERPFCVRFSGADGNVEACSSIARTTPIAAQVGVRGFSIGTGAPTARSLTSAVPDRDRARCFLSRVGCRCAGRVGDLTVRFVWPWALAGFVALAILIGAVVWLRRRRRKYAATFASLSLIRAARPERSRWRRMVPAALLLAAIAGLVVAMARPQALVATSRSDTSIILTLDVSRSMCSTDVSPNRLSAAEAAAHKFVADQPGGTRLGLVAFAGTAQLLVPPTTDRDRLNTAIDGLATGDQTAIGDAVLAAVDALARVNHAIAPSRVKLTSAERRRNQFVGKYVPDVVVLLTDGSANAGVDPLDAARQAADRGVRVFTIGFGTTRPTPLACTAAQFGGETLGPSSGGVPFAGHAARQRPRDRRAHPPRHRPHDGWYLRPRRQRGSTRTRVTRASEAYRDSETGTRAHGLPRRPERAPGDRRGRDLAVVEPVLLTASGWNVKARIPCSLTDGGQLPSPRAARQSCLICRGPGS